MKTAGQRSALRRRLGYRLEPVNLWAQRPCKHERRSAPAPSDDWFDLLFTFITAVNILTSSKLLGNLI